MYANRSTVLNDGSFESLTEDVLNLRHKFEESRDAMVKYHQYAIIMASRAMHSVSYMSGRLNALEVRSLLYVKSCLISLTYSGFYRNAGTSLRG